MHKITKTNEQNQENTKCEILSEVSEAVKQTNIEKLIQNATVVKRNGRIVPFHKERIQNAIEAAFRDVKSIPKPTPLDDDLISAIEEMTNSVVTQALTLGDKGISLTVEGIQDLVEITLMKNGFHDVAKGYIIYRDKQKEAREDSIENIKIYRIDDIQVRFNPMKFSGSIEHLFRRFHGIEGETPDEIIETVNNMTKILIDEIYSLSQIKQLHVSDIQDLTEKFLMKEGFFEIAKEYILQRVGKLEEMKERKRQSATKDEKTFEYITHDAKTKIMTRSRLLKKAKHACHSLDNTNAEELLDEAIKNFYKGIKEEEIDRAMIMAARAKIEREPEYTKVASRLLLDVIYRESMQVSFLDPDLKQLHKKYFTRYLKKGISVGRVSEKLLDFDLEAIASALDIERDDLFSYLGLQTLYDRYFLHHLETRIETPQIFWMRVSMGLAIEEADKTQKAIEFYNTLSRFHYTSATPTLFNAGTPHSQLSSCYLLTVMDDLHHIFKTVSDDAQLSKWAGGIGNDWTNVRATGSRIHGTNGKSQGVIPFLKVANDTAVAVNQCFNPDTRIFTNQGVKPIANVAIGDLVLGISGTYREVTDRFVYNQKDPMIAINIKHSLEPIHVTTAHPFYAMQGVPKEQAVSRTHAWIEKGKVSPTWVEAAQLKVGDYIAQAIPKEVVVVPELTEDDARLYGILLGDGHLSKSGSQWGVSGNPKSDAHLDFIREYLTQHGIHFWETARGDSYIQIHWAAGRGVVRDATSGQFVSSGAPTLPFEHADLYDNEGNKYIAPRFAHLPKQQLLALLQGLIETDGNVSRGKEITFCNTSLHLIEGVRYQCLRLGIPTAGNRRERSYDHEARRSDASTTTFKGSTISYDLRIPAVASLAEKVGCQPVTKQNWLSTPGFVWSRITSVEDQEKTAVVCDLVVEGDESYMTTAGLAHNGGKRKGAMCAYLETWHLDIEDFLELRKNTGDERRRTHDMNTANWIPDLFMKRVQENGSWTLFSPSNVPDLHSLYGEAFEKRYLEYEAQVESGELKLFKKVEAVALWRKMLSMLFETGHPWITFKDAANVRSPQDHMGVINSSNLCTEIFLNTSETETAVCNLGSINLVEHVTKEGIDEKKLASTVEVAIRMLDNVIDINFYPTQEARNANVKHRPIGLGIMGFQDALCMRKISYASHEAINFADEIMELIAYYAILASTKLAKERGTYSSYKGSKWDRGILPIDTLDLLEKERGTPIDVERTMRKDWTKVREAVKKYGMRNSNTMAIAPTATIANIIGVSPSIEPNYKNLYVKSNLSGEFTISNRYLVDDLKEIGLWNDEMLDDLKYYDGSLSEIPHIPQDIKMKYLTAFEIDPDWIIKCAGRRQKWIDMGQSLNLYLSEPSGKKMHEMYFLAWKNGLKSTYYLRALAATQIEKSSVDINKRGLQPRWMKNSSASSNIKVDRSTPKMSEGAVCSMEEGCESCQ
ncbi:MAG: ribonucleoside-diphosphate reductase subunit alpha [Simkaniaceae bacterium]|nr:ribonucleoside-diphosphate reductase subunit alpha [Simkaniaceae bacterium]